MNLLPSGSGVGSPALGPGAADVLNTAGFINAMRNMSPSLGGDAAAALQYASSPTVVHSDYQQPSQQAAPAPVSAPLNSAYLHAMAAAAAAQQAPQQAGQAAPTINDYLSQLIGSAPNAPQASDFGPAPTLDQFFSADPYNQALASLASGVKNAQGSIGTAYNGANNTMGQVAALVGQNNATARAAMNADQSHAVNALNGFAQQAQAQAGPGGGVAARLAALQGTLAGQQGAQNSLADEMGNIQNFNVSQDKAAVGLNQQAALGSLAAANSAQQNKIGFAEAQDKARAQQELLAANNSRGAAQAKAQQEYQVAMRDYNAQRLTALQDATKMAGGGQLTTPHDKAVQQMIDWSNSGDQNGSALAQAASQVISGAGLTDSSTGKSPGVAKDYGEALARLNSNPSIPRGSPEYQLLAGMLGNYFQNNKVPSSSPDVLGALRTMVGG